MTGLSNPPTLSELRNASSPTSQIRALRELKNEIIGHEEKKELWVRLGVVVPLARILSSYKGNGKKKYRESNGAAGPLKSRVARSEEEEARYQAIIIVGSLAFGGPAFLAPLYAGHVVSPLLSLLSPAESHPQVTVQALRALNTIADSARLLNPRLANHEDGLTSLLYTHPHLGNICSLLTQTSCSVVIWQQVDLAASLIFKTCSTEHHRALLVQTGVLEALAANIASIIPSSFPRPQYDLDSVRFQQNIPPRLAILLNAASQTIKGSRSRALKFLTSPAFTSAFGQVEEDLERAQEYDAYKSGRSPNTSTRQSALRNLESFMPLLPSPHSRSGASIHGTHGSLGGSGSYGRSAQASQSLSTAIEVIQNQGLEYVGEEESPLIPWLLWIFRSQDQVIGLAASEILVNLNRLGLVKRPKESLFALLLVPPLVQMLDKDLRALKDASNGSNPSKSRPVHEAAKDEAPAILAMLTSNNLETQKAAAEAGAIKTLSQLLKQSFDPLPATSATSLWTPEPSPGSHPSVLDDSCRLGSTGVSSATYHTLRLRESVLAALAALASDKDDYRKEIIDNGVIQFVIETLKATPPDSKSLSIQSNPTTSESPSDVLWSYREAILAACGAAKALSRSVSTLRTSLMDAGLAAPLFVLLRSPDVEIQVAATAVVCNLVLKFSPMREAIMEGGILSILCNHAHSVNGKLRLNSLWALKHVIIDASNTVKMACLEELGPSWLKQLLMNEIEPSSPPNGSRTGAFEDGRGTPIKMNTPNAAGEQVDLLNAVMDSSREPGRGLEEAGDEDLPMSDSIGALTHDYLRLHAIAEGLEGSFTESVASQSSKKMLSDEIAIQKEALEIIRNLICGDQSPAMIDHIFRELGQEKVFDLLAAKLRPKVMNVFSRDRRSAEGGIRHIQPQTEIVLAVCFTIIHIAAGQPRHRQVLVAQTELLKLLVPLFNHSTRLVRSCCAWIVINITWVENVEDKVNAKARAQELRRLGFLDKIEAMDKDESLDCRERSKTAREQLRALLHS